MFINLSAISEGEWFPFRMSTVNPDTGETIWGEEMPGVRVKIKSWKKFFENSFLSREQIAEWKVHPKTHQNQKHINQKQMTPKEIIVQKEDGIDYAILEWEGFKDKKTKKDIECNRENKIAMMSLDFFDRFFSDAQLSIDRKKIEEAEEKEKN